MAWASGGSATLTYSTSGTPTSTAPAPGYLVRILDDRGRSLSFTYVLPAGADANTRGLLSTMTNQAGRQITFSYDGAGNLKTVTWPDGTVRTFLV